MKVHVITASVIAILLNCVSAFAADTAVLPMTDIVKRLRDAGYNSVHEIELSRDVYKAEVLSHQGSKLDLKIDAKTGTILNLPKKTDVASITFEEALSRIEKAGYTKVEMIKLDNETAYEAKAFDSQGKKVKLQIDLYSGAVSVE